MALPPNDNLQNSNLNLVFFGVVTECQSPVSCYAQAPGSFTIPFHLMHLPHWQGFQLVQALHILQETQHIIELCYRMCRNAALVALDKEPFQPLMHNVSDLHNSL